MNLHDIPKEVPTIPWEVVADMEGVYMGYGQRHKEWTWNPVTRNLFYLDPYGTQWRSIYNNAISIGAYHPYVIDYGAGLEWIKSHIKETLDHFILNIDPTFNPS